MEKSLLLLDEKQHIILGKGEVLVSATNSVTVDSGGNIVSLGPGAIALVSLNQGVTRVRNLYERTRNSVYTRVGSQTFNLAAGEEALLVASKSYHISLLDDQIGRRRIKRSDLRGGVSVASPDISLVALLHRSKVLRQVVNSKKTRDKLLASRLIRMAACLQLVTSTHGPYLAVHQ